jgi:hypothetical protein
MFSITKHVILSKEEVNLLQNVKCKECLDENKLLGTNTLAYFVGAPMATKKFHNIGASK